MRLLWYDSRTSVQYVEERNIIIGLFLKLLDRNVSVAFVQLLRNWHSKLTASVMWNNFLGVNFSIFCGVRQGGVLSSMLFSVYIDDLIRFLRHSGYGTFIGSQFIVIWIMSWFSETAGHLCRIWSKMGHLFQC